MYHIYRPESSKGKKNLLDLDSCPFEGFLHVWVCVPCPSSVCLGRNGCLRPFDGFCARLTVRFLRPFCARVWLIFLLIVKKMLFCFFCTRQTVSAQRGTNHQKVYNEHLYPTFWVRTKVQVYIYICILYRHTCLLCPCVCLCVYSAAQF